MTVNRCVCFDKTFAELKAIAEKHQVQTLEELQQWVMFGEQCKLCHPYIRVMLGGKTEAFQQQKQSE